MFVDTDRPWPLDWVGVSELRAGGGRWTAETLIADKRRELLRIREASTVQRPERRPRASRIAYLVKTCLVDLAKHPPARRRLRHLAHSKNPKEGPQR